MPLVRADWHEVLTVLRETGSIWSAGLTPHDYRRYIWLQMHHHWARGHYRFFVYKENGKIVSSCKVYRVGMSSRGREYNFLGVGAIYTMRDHRHKHYASDMLDKVLDLAESEDVDGLLLFSDIGAELYEEFGFIEAGSAEFSVYLNLPESDGDRESDGQQMSGAEFAAGSAGESVASGWVSGSLVTTTPLKDCDLSWLNRHHQRWLRYQPFGLVRDDAYWRYKVAREDFLNHHSNLSWPELQVMMIDSSEHGAGYAITESGGNTLRILEVIGSAGAREVLWKAVFECCVEKNYRRVRGWESVIRDFAPNYHFQKFEKLAGGANLGISEMHYTERAWGRCMINPINAELFDWVDVNPCPVLELDHL